MEEKIEPKAVFCRTQWRESWTLNSYSGVPANIIRSPFYTSHINLMDSDRLFNFIMKSSILGENRGNHAAMEIKSRFVNLFPDSETKFHRRSVIILNTSRLAKGIGASRCVVDR
jgi:hypothetical protein